MDSRIGGRPAGSLPADASPHLPPPNHSPHAPQRAWRVSAGRRDTRPTAWAIGAAVLIVALLTAGLHLLFR